jgi:hypothetical protein
MRSALSLLFVVLFACVVPVDRGGPAPEPEPVSEPNPDPCDSTFYVSDEFTDAEIAAIHRANARWNDYGIAQNCVEPRADETERAIYRLQHGSDQWRKMSKDFGGEILGAFQGSSGSIWIVGDLEPELFELVALHEFGHARGLAHVDGVGVMSPGVSGVYDFTGLDLEECRRVSACR